MANVTDERAAADRHARRALELAKDGAAVLAVLRLHPEVINGELKERASLTDRCFGMLVMR